MVQIVGTKSFREGILILEVKDKNRRKDVSVDYPKIKKMRYASTLQSRGIAKEDIYLYGFGFDGKEVMIAGGINTD